MSRLPTFGLGAVLAVTACGLPMEGAAIDGASTAPESTRVDTPGTFPDPSGGEGTTNPPGAAETPTAPPGVAPDAFSGAPPYMAMLGPSTLDTSGKGNGHLSFTADGNPAGQPCLTCHVGGKGKPPAFRLAGTIYSDAAGTKPATGIEVRVVGDDDKAFSAYTDDNGNFFVRADEAKLPRSPIVGARSATTSLTMTGTLQDADCNSCHGSTTRIAL